MLARLKLLAVAAMAVAGVAAASLAAAAEKPIKMGMMIWEDTASISLITAKFLEEKGFEVDKTEFSEWGIAFGALEKGDIDILVSHINYVTSDYWARSRNRLEKVSPVSFGLRQGFVVPDYMNITSIDQLNSVRDQVGGKIVGVEPGSGLMREVGDAVEQYGLDYQVIEGSTPAMIAELQAALERKDPIVTMLWDPSWMIQKFPVHFLDDPKGVFAPPQAYYWIARKGFSAENPRAREAIASVYVPIGDVSAISSELNAGKTMPEAVDDWWAKNEALVGKWSVMAGD